MHGIQYMVIATPVDYAASLASCSAAGMQLATIDSEHRAVDLHAAVQAVVGNSTSYWLGAQETSAASGEWWWHDGTPWLHPRWEGAGGGASTSSQDCLVVDPSNGRWLARPCHAERHATVCASAGEVLSAWDVNHTCAA